MDNHCIICGHERTIGAQKSIQFNPDSSSQINVGDSLILIGDLKHIEKFRREVCNVTHPLAEHTRNSEIINL